MLSEGITGEDAEGGMMCDWPKCEERSVYKTIGGFPVCGDHLEAIKLIAVVIPEL